MIRECRERPPAISWATSVPLVYLRTFRNASGIKIGASLLI
jgi:hypothetical protein